jgi:hypothetical protein
MGDEVYERVCRTHECVREHMRQLKLPDDLDQGQYRDEVFLGMVTGLLAEAMFAFDLRYALVRIKAETQARDVDHQRLPQPDEAEHEAHRESFLQLVNDLWDDINLVEDDE